MSSPQPLRVFVSDGARAAAEETIVQQWAELSRQRGLPGVCAKPRIQLHSIVVPQHFLAGTEHLCDKSVSVQQEEPELTPVEEPQRNLSTTQREAKAVKQETVTSTLTPARQEEDENALRRVEDLCDPQRNFNLNLRDKPGPRQAKEEQEEVDISRDEERLDVKQETESFMVTSAAERAEVDADRPQVLTRGFNVKDRRYQHQTLCDPDVLEGTNPAEFRELKTHVKVRKEKKRSFKFTNYIFLNHGGLTYYMKKVTQKTNLSGESSESPKPRPTPAAEKSYSCEICGRSFGQRSNLRTHVRTHTGEKPYSCQKCDKRFNQKSHLVDHTRTHTGEKPFPCALCSKRFSQKSHLKEHMRTHSGKKPFFCEECGKSFSQKSHVVEHMRTHTGEKPFSCEKCSRSFGQQSVLIRHMKGHAGEQPFCCEECGKSFSHGNYLVQHRRTHTGEKPFCCRECRKCFSQRSILIRHMKTHTAEKTTPAIRGKAKSARLKKTLKLKDTSPSEPDVCEIELFI